MSASDRLAAEQTATAEMTVEVSSQNQRNSVALDGRMDFENGETWFAIDDALLGSFEVIGTENELFVRSDDLGWLRIELDGDLEDDAVAADRC